jgi:hypothetical protein
MREPVTIPENVRYVESFGPRWVQAVLRRQVDLSLLEENRRRVASRFGSSGCPVKLEGPSFSISFFRMHFPPGKAPLKRDLRASLLAFFEGSRLYAAAGRILADARLSPGDFHWRAEMRDGLPSIAGNDEATIQSLGALAHELGHCLYERACLAAGKHSGQVQSEACAMALEEWIVGQALAGETKLAWHSYQRSVDQLNEAFHHLERGISLPLVHEPHLLPLRATFYTAFGYQGIYREASLARKTALAAWPANIDALLGRFNLPGLS